LKGKVAEFGTDVHCTQNYILPRDRNTN